MSAVVSHNNIRWSEKSALQHEVTNVVDYPCVDDCTIWLILVTSVDAGDSRVHADAVAKVIYVKIVAEVALHGAGSSSEGATAVAGSAALLQIAALAAAAAIAQWIFV